MSELKVIGEEGESERALFETLNTVLVKAKSHFGIYIYKIEIISDFYFYSTNNHVNFCIFFLLYS